MVNTAVSCFCAFPIKNTSPVCLPQYSATWCPFFIAPWKFQRFLYPQLSSDFSCILLTIFPHLVQTKVKATKKAIQKQTKNQIKNSNRNKGVANNPPPSPTPKLSLLYYVYIGVLCFCLFVCLFVCLCLCVCVCVCVLCVPLSHRPKLTHCLVA